MIFFFIGMVIIGNGIDFINRFKKVNYIFWNKNLIIYWENCIIVVVFFKLCKVLNVFFICFKIIFL